MMWLFLTMLACSSPVSEPHDDDHAEDDHAEVVELSEEAMRSARIEVSAAAEGILEQGLSMSARIALDPRREALISVWIAGQVDAISVRTGDPIRQGQTLATVQSPELGEAIAAFRAASARDSAADVRLARLKRLEEAGVTSHAEVLESEADHAAAEGAREAAEERLRILGVDPSIGDPHAGEHYVSHVRVRSPIRGKVLSTDISVGERVAPGQALFHVGDLDEVWLLLNVYERDLSLVQAGQPVRFTVEAWPDEVFEGTVEQIGDWLDPDARTIEVRVTVENADHRLKPNMFAQATLSVGRSDAAAGVLLPLSALQEFEGQTVAFVEESPRHFTPRPVQVAARSSAQAQLSSGLIAGERVVTAGAFALKSELEKGALGSGHAH
jgi:cobalt-zinc-cadmium efflux system membrane fusion protein